MSLDPKSTYSAKLLLFCSPFKLEPAYPSVV